jgi:hypothetical protein
MRSKPPAPDPRLVYFPQGTSKKNWRKARSCGYGCDLICKGRCDGKTLASAARSGGGEQT